MAFNGASLEVPSFFFLPVAAETYHSAPKADMAKVTQMRMDNSFFMCAPFLMDGFWIIALIDNHG